MQSVKGKRIFVGLSGGVDSAVTATLLKEQGADVVGVFIKGWYPPGMPCTWAADRRDAMRVAAYLGIPFHTLDASTEYKQGVIDYLLREYKAGRTPNPDIMCNREVKFGAFYRFAMAYGADYIATGHYARTREVEGKTVLVRGIDPAKDQSYFLWAVPQEALGKTLFPLGGHKKKETRVLAQKWKLPVATKKDSQGICFLGSISVEDFLREEFGEKRGKARTVGGEEVGIHNGAALHTIGERIGLEGTGSGPWYVVAKDIEQNILTVSHDRGVPNPPESISLTETNWFLPYADMSVIAQYRYHGPRVPGTITNDRSAFVPSVALAESIAHGQSLVVYNDDVCIGGGIIG